MVPQRYHLLVPRDLKRWKLFSTELPSNVPVSSVWIQTFILFCFILKQISLCHTVGAVSEIGEKTIYFLFYCSQRLSLLPESWTLEDHLEAWNIPAWLPWGECRHAFQSEGGSRAGEGPRSAGSGLSQVCQGTSQSSWTQRILCSLIHGKLALFKRACTYLQ